MYFKDKAYYLKKAKEYAGLAISATLFVAFVILMFVLA